MRALRETPKVADRPICRRVLDERADHAGLEDECFGFSDDETDPPGLRSRPHHRDGLRMTILVHEKDRRSLDAAYGERQAHRLGRRRRLVEQRGVGDRQRRQIGHHRLEVEQCLEPPL